MLKFTFFMEKKLKFDAFKMVTSKRIFTFITDIIH